MRYCIQHADGSLSDGIVTTGTNPPPQHLIDQATSVGGEVLSITSGSFPDTPLHLCKEDPENLGTLIPDNTKIAAENMRETLRQKAAIIDQKTQLQTLRDDPLTTAEERAIIDTMIAELDAAVATIEK